MSPPADKISLDALNTATTHDFVRLIGPTFEHAGWVAERAAGRRPFATVEALHRAMFDGVLASPEEQRLAFIRNHPELAGREAVAGTMTTESTSEQGSAGLDRLSAEEFARLGELNKVYRERFGMPCIICVRHYTRPALLAEFERRLERSMADEIDAALAQIFAITRLRVAARVEGPGMPHTDGRLSTHILDAAQGRPAPGVLVELRDISDGGAGVLMRSLRTNANGRTDEPVIGGQPLRIGVYEFAFHVGEYFAGRDGTRPGFLDIVPVRFGIAEPESHYHVPLLATPWSYSTYRGS